MTPEEKVAVQRETRFECARIAALESHYWADLDDERPGLAEICIGALGASANIAAAILMGKTEEQVREEIERRQASKEPK